MILLINIVSCCLEFSPIVFYLLLYSLLYSIFKPHHKMFFPLKVRYKFSKFNQIPSREGWMRSRRGVYLIVNNNLKKTIRMKNQQAKV